MGLIRRTLTYKVECDKGCSYTIDADHSPLICGICGDRAIRVWTLTYDALSVAIRERIEQKGGNLGRL
jgi:hypothetical protein